MRNQDNGYKGLDGLLGQPRKWVRLMKIGASTSWADLLYREEQ
jgi:hypothetical protein